jgi:phosphatidylserine decarboxylase
MRHQYLERHSRQVRDERLLGDRMINYIYSNLRESSPRLFAALTGARMSSLLAFVNYDSLLGARLAGGPDFVRACGVDLSECLDDPAGLDTPRKVFERRIRYWEVRPMPATENEVVSPSDSRLLLGSLARESLLFLKEKFFTLPELVGEDKRRWLTAFDGGDYAVFRLTPEKYHYNHAPVSGRVVDHYAIDGHYHSCNPGAVVSLAAPYSKNKRVVTIIDSDVPGGTACGLVAMVEVVALMIGEVRQAYSRQAYDDPSPVLPGMFIRRGQPKSLFRPGSSTVVLLFQPGRVAFAPDLVENQRAPGVSSRFASGLTAPLVETEVRVRMGIGRARPAAGGRS